MNQNVYSVSALVYYIKQTLDSDIRIQSILIKEGISNLTNHHNGHRHFTLKGTRSKVSCVTFSFHARHCNILLKEGMRVVVTASASMYEAGRSVQLYVTAVRSDGPGDLFLQLEEMKKKLAAQGLFDPQKKKPLLRYSMRIDAITAKTRAATQGIPAMVSRRWPLTEAVVYSSLVQGIQTSGTIIENLCKVDQGGHGVILLARGDGPIEDLWCFNEKAVARAVFAMHTVIVTGVGHKADTALVDHVSDARAPIPIAAAELVTPDSKGVHMNIPLMRRRLIKDMETRLHMTKQTPEPIRSHRCMCNPLSYIREEEVKLAIHVQQLSIMGITVVVMTMQLKQNFHKLAIHGKRLFQKNIRSITESGSCLTQALHDHDTLQKRQIENINALLDTYSPLKGLSHGYTIAYHSDEAVSSVDAVEQNGRLHLRIQDGCLYTNIEKKEKL